MHYWRSTLRERDAMHYWSRKVRTPCIHIQREREGEGERERGRERDRANREREGPSASELITGTTIAPDYCR